MSTRRLTWLSALAHAVHRSLQTRERILVWIHPTTGMVYVRSVRERNPGTGCTLLTIFQHGKEERKRWTHQST